MKLHIVIPAYNEEQSIAAIIRRTLAARPAIIARSPVDQVEITVVSDGSTDRTAEIARQFAADITLVEFPRNRGYGAAIQTGWQSTDAELLGFLDADGTCDPEFFAALCQALVQENADMALGNRMHRQSRMPLIRRLGNFLFAHMLSLFAAQKVTDTASGMRVIRRASLPKLLPLPEGMHFTPALSARAILDENLRVTEVDMPYHERQGQSKLKVWRDGVRFFKVIVEAAMLYRPFRLLELLGAICFLTGAGWMIWPILHYLKTRTVAEWMIYRFVVSNLLGISACLFFCAGYLTHKITDLVLFGRPEATEARWLDTLMRRALAWYCPATLFVLGGALVLPSFREWLATGATHEHWSRFIVMSFFYAVGAILLGTRLIDHSLTLMAQRLEFLQQYAALPPGDPSSDSLEMRP